MAVYKRKYKGKYRKGKKSLAKKVNALYSIVKQQKPELKYKETYNVSGTTYFTPAGTLLDLTDNISQGTGDSGARIGDMIYLKSLNMRFRVTLPSAGETTLCRIIVFSQLRNPDSTLADGSVANYILESTYNNGPEVALSTRDFDNRRCYKTHYDKTFVMNANDITTDISKFIHIRLKIPRYCARVQYSNASSTAATTNQLYCLLLGGLSGANTVYSSYTSRLNYIDN